MKKINMDTFTGIFFIAFSLVIFQQISILSPNAIENGAGFFPTIVASCMMVLAISLTIRSFFDKKALKFTFKKRGTIRVALLTALSIGYIVIMPIVGFLISSLLFFAPLLLLFGFKKNVLFFVLSVIVPVVLFVLFKYVLLVPLP